MTLTETLWRTPGHDRHFIIPDDAPRAPGSLALVSLAGEELHADPAWAGRYEVTEAEARAWAQEEFGFALAGLRRRVDSRLARAREALHEAKRTPVAPGNPLTPDAVPAILSFAGKLPRAVLEALSGDPSRVMAASGKLAEAEQRLAGAGIDTGSKLAGFAFRLASLRKEFEAARRID